MESFIVMLCGKARHGKDTYAQLLQERIPGSKIYSLALAVRIFARVMGLMKEKDGSILQMIGTDLFRKKDPDFWINILKLQIEEENPRVAIISDGRFLNEKQFGDENGLSIRVTRLNENCSLYISDDRPKDHPSECELDDIMFDYYADAITGHRHMLEQHADNHARLINNYLLGDQADGFK